MALPASVLRFPSPDKFIGMMKSAGFAVVEHTPMPFGIVPVVLTWYLQASSWDSVGLVIETSLTIGLLAVNDLVVNNYRDMEDDAAVGKRTTVVIFGRKAMSVAYLLSGFIGMSVMPPVWLGMPAWVLAVPLIYLTLHINIWLVKSTCL